MKKFTFKTNKPTGRFRCFGTASHTIKYNKIDVGRIVDKEWKVKFMVVKSDILEDGNPNCKWKWITLKKEFTSLDEAKIFLNDHVTEILAKFNLVTE